MTRIRFAGIEIDNLTTYEALSSIQAVIGKKQAKFIVTPNAAHVAMLQNDDEFRAVYSGAYMVVADGMPLIWASRLLYTPLKEKISGSDLFETICGLAEKEGANIFLLGGNNGSEVKAAGKLREKFPGIKVNTYSPPLGFETDEKETARILDKIRAHNTDVVFVCVGAPKSEKWIFRNIREMNVSFACPFGNSLEFFAGTLKRAPKWMQNSGLEWSWRLYQEPRRLWKRYLIGNSVFAYLVFREVIRKIMNQ